MYNDMMADNSNLTEVATGWSHEGHVVNHAMAIKYGAIYYPYPTSTVDDSLAMHNGTLSLHKYHGQPGRWTGDECLAGTEAWHGTEMCAIVEQMYSYSQMIEVFGKIEWADKLEFVAYNHLTGHITPDGWNRQYDGQMNQVLVSNAGRRWTTNGNTANMYGNFDCAYYCCTTNMHQGWPKFAMHTWMATHDNGLAAVVYAPSKVTAKVFTGEEVTITEETDYPFKNTVKFTISTAEQVLFPLVVRVPLWGEGTTIQVPNGATIEAPEGGDAATGLSAGQWVKITHLWNDNDEVVVTLPFDIKVEEWDSDHPNHTINDVTVRRGPLYYALRIPERQWSKEVTYPNGMGAADWAISTSSDWNYALMLDMDNPATCFEVVEQNVDSDYPWGMRGDPVWDEGSNSHVNLTSDVPVILKTKGKLVPSWGMDNNSAATAPVSPIQGLSTPEVDIELVPFGSTKLRVSMFPWVEAQGWVARTREPGAPVELKASVNASRSLVSVTANCSYTFKVFTVSGEQVYSAKAFGSKKFDLRSLPKPALYFVNIAGEDNSSYATRFFRM
jgi:hypothetical protein